MNSIYGIIAGMPLFRHCTDGEIGELLKAGKLARIRKGQHFDIKTTHSFNVIISGIFEIEAFGNKDVVYMSPGSFFGSIPFAETRQTGMIRAGVDSTLLIFDIDLLYRYFLRYWKACRGFTRVLHRMGYDISEPGKKLVSTACTVTAFTGSRTGAGASVMTALAGMAASGNGKTIILDLSYRGTTVFTYLDRKITSPLSQKEEDVPAVDRLIRERMEVVHDTLHLLNISHGSRVRVNPDILSPILFILGSEYRHVLLDLSDSDPEMRDAALAVSDVVVCMLAGERAGDETIRVLDDGLTGGQRLLLVLNGHHSPSTTRFTGGKILDPLGGEGSSWLERLKAATGRNDVTEIVSLCQRPRRALVLEPALFESLYYTAIITGARDKYDCIATASYSAVLLLALLAGTGDDVLKRISRFFSQDMIKGLLAVRFPENHVFGSGPVVKAAADLCGRQRIEAFNTLPMIGIHDPAGKGRFFTTGNAGELMAASYVMAPVFEPVSIGGNPGHSGFPRVSTTVEYLLRTDCESVDYVAVDNRQDIRVDDPRILGFYREYLAGTSKLKQKVSSADVADKSHIIQVNESELNVEKMIAFSEEIAEQFYRS